MSREIKFRIWNGSQMEHNIMSGYLGNFYVAGIDEKDSACMSSFNTIYDKNIPLMQYTGLKDKNFTDIYEGDVLKFKQYIGGNFVEHHHETLYVVWDELHACFRFRNIENVGGRQPFSSYDGHELEIIGNIYENPDLLK